MYAAPVPVAASPARSAWPLAAICCLGLLGLLIAATIVLALIPVYLPNSSAATRGTAGRSFYARYRAQNPNPTQTATGRIANTQAVAPNLAAAADANVDEGAAVDAATRRKRDVVNHREKRASFVEFIFRLTPVFSADCVSDSCVTSVITRVQQKIRNGRSFTAPITIITATGTITQTFTLVLLSFSETQPSDFATALSGGSAGGTTASTSTTSTNFTAAQSGTFFTGSTWVGGVVPTGNNITINIPAGITVSIPVAVFSVSVATWSIFGTLRLGDGFSTFQFLYPTSIIIRNGGQILDLTSSRRILAPSGTAINQLSGGTLPAGTQIQVSVSGRAVGDVVTISTSKSATIGILPSGIRKFNKTTPICNSHGGDIQDPNTFLGGVAPLDEFCADDCDLDIPDDFGLTTTSLKGKMTLKIALISVAEAADLALGTIGVAGFVFSKVIAIKVKGKLKFAGDAGSIRLPEGCELDLLEATAIFLSDVEVALQSFNLLSGDDIGIPGLLPTNTKGPFFVTITLSGLIASILNSGGNDVTLATVSPSTPTGGSTASTGAGGSTASTGAGGSTASTGAGGSTASTGAGGSTASTGAGGSTASTGAGGSTASTGAGGSTGATGSGESTGATGSGGSTGATGSGGSTGATGSGGSTGATGSGGSTGATGSGGSTGATGSGESTGATGSGGSTGATGSGGSTGATGSGGSTGATGSGGSTGATGSGGSTGATGSGGSTGETGSGGSTGATGSGGSTGATGSGGSTGATGSGGSTGATGSGGSTGATGSGGSTGATGSGGSTGETGSGGSTGATGSGGSTGATGSGGSTGATGSGGSTGSTGAGSSTGGSSTAGPSTTPVFG